jgi:hypothetical protein
MLYGNRLFLFLSRTVPRSVVIPEAEPALFPISNGRTSQGNEFRRMTNTN